MVHETARPSPLPFAQSGCPDTKTARASLAIPADPDAAPTEQGSAVRSPPNRLYAMRTSCSEIPLLRENLAVRPAPCAPVSAQARIAARLTSQPEVPPPQSTRLLCGALAAANHQRRPKPVAR